jgi:hypothetical protein
MTAAKDLRVFIGLGEISGYCSKLTEGLKSLGVNARFVNLREHPFQYDVGDEWRLAKLIQYCFKRYKQSSSIARLFWGVVQVILRAALLVRVIGAYDVFIFGYGNSFLFLYDLPILKFLGKKIIFVFFGSDARPPYVTGTFTAADDPQTVADCIRAARQVRRRIRRIERYADAVLSHPPFGLFHEKPYVLNAIVGFPFDFPDEYPAEKSAQNPTSVRILHSPSNPTLKGTPEIRQAIEHLRTKGYVIEWIELTGQPNAVVLRELARCDFIVDQLYSDWLMAGFATEAAAAGKPSVVGGYDLAAMQKLFPPESTPPVQACHPDAIEVGIEKLITDRTYRLELGQRAQAFVEAYWETSQIAARFLRIIQGDIPAEWLYDPGQTEPIFLHGGGVSEVRLVAFLKVYIKQGSRAALQLADKPALEQAFVDFVTSAKASE